MVLLDLIHFKTGDLLAEETEALVNTVNCVGVMGKGIALDFKKTYPSNFHEYAAACKRGDVKPGHMHIFETNNLANPRYIVNFPTKRHWRDTSLIRDIDAGLSDLARVIRDRRFESIALPALGCGLGGLNWADVRPLIVNALEDFEDVDIVVFEPTKARIVAA